MDGREELLSSTPIRLPQENGKYELRQPALVSQIRRQLLIFHLVAFLTKYGPFVVRELCVGIYELFILR